MTTKKKTDTFFEPCPDRKCFKRFGSPESWLAHVDEHRRKFVEKQIPPEQQHLLDPGHHAKRLMKKLGY